MASRFRSFSRPAFSLFRSAAKNSNIPGARPLPSDLLPRRPLTFSRVPREVGCLESMLPLHSAVSSALLTSRLGVDSGGPSRSLYQGMICSSNPGV